MFLSANLNDLPLEILRLIAMYSSIPDFDNLCQTSKRLAQLTRDEIFWSLRVRKDFSYGGNAPTTYRKLYYDLEEALSVIVVQGLKLESDICDVWSEASSL